VNLESGPETLSTRVFRGLILDRLKNFRADLNRLKMRASETGGPDDGIRDAILDLEEKFSLIEDRLFEFSQADEADRFRIQRLVERAWEVASRAFDAARVKYLH